MTCSFKLLQTNICDERVCSMETSGTALIPEHSYPHRVAKWGATNRFENLKYCRGPKFLFACPLHPPHPHSIKQGKGTAFGDQRIVTLVFEPQTTIIINVRLKVSLTFFSIKFKLQPLMQTFFFSLQVSLSVCHQRSAPLPLEAVYRINIYVGQPWWHVLNSGLADMKKGRTYE